MIDVADIARDVSAPARARAHVEQVGACLDADVREDVKLLVSELITNSVKYGGNGAVTLELRIGGPRQVRAEVIDQGIGFEPVARAADRVEPGGWGLELVEMVADRWGAHAGSTHVWFEIER